MIDERNHLDVAERQHIRRNANDRTFELSLVIFRVHVQWDNGRNALTVGPVLFQ